MVESLVITLREGIEAALVLGIILAYLRKSGRHHLRRPVYLGLGLAVAASFAVAWVLRAIDLDPDNEYLEGSLMAVAGIFVASMVVWMWRTARGLKHHMETRLSTLAAEEKVGRGAGLGILLFTFFMVFREGVETVLFLQAVALGEKADPLGLFGAMLGLGLATLFAVLFVRGSLRIDLARFFKVTGVVLLVLAGKLLAGSVHEFGEARVIPLNKEVMSVLGYVVRDDTATMLVVALVAVPIFLLLWESMRQPRSSGPREDESAAGRRKRLAAARLERVWQLGLAAATLAIVLALATTAFAGSKLVDPEPVPVKAGGQEVRIPVASLQEGHLHKFAFTTASGTTVRFLMVLKKDGSVAAALDACQICGAVGFGQDGDVIICKNCNAPIAFDSLGSGGGCNPIVLNAKVAGQEVAVSVRQLEESAGRFQ